MNAKFLSHLSCMYFKFLKTSKKLIPTRKINYLSEMYEDNFAERYAPCTLKFFRDGSYLLDLIFTILGTSFLFVFICNHVFCFSTVACQ